VPEADRRSGLKAQDLAAQELADRRRGLVAEDLAVAEADHRRGREAEDRGGLAVDRRADLEEEDRRQLREADHRWDREAEDRLEDPKAGWVEDRRRAGLLADHLQVQWDRAGGAGGGCSQRVRPRRGRVLRFGDRC
jgi:hypothetical protein